MSRQGDCVSSTVVLSVPGLLTCPEDEASVIYPGSRPVLDTLHPNFYILSLGGYTNNSPMRLQVALHVSDPHFCRALHNLSLTRVVLLVYVFKEASPMK